MDVRNIAIVFGPTLVRTKDDSMITMVKDMSDQCRIIESVISYVSHRRIIESVISYVSQCRIIESVISYVDT